MSNPFFDHPILNSPYDYPVQHWELDKDGQPTQKVIETRRRAEFITPIPKPKKRRSSSEQQQPKLSYSKNGTSFKDRNTKKKGNKAKL